ncbi:MAG: DUF4430 domain-containing protein [Oscillospiraceae bacterium]|nr:DUF4430 domain-containing protein [Oscillospiraceae bacterium]
MSEKKSNKKLLIAVSILLLLVVVAGLVWFFTRPKAVSGSKNVTVILLLADETDIVHQISTDAEFLVDLLSEQSLIPDSDVLAGFVTTIDGITADASQEEWWMMTVNGEFANYGIAELPVIDGDSYEFTLTVGWDF